MKLWDEFKAFAFKGNVIDMAVGVVIGGAFGKIVTSLVNDVIMPLVGLLTGSVSFSELSVVLKETVGEDGEIIRNTLNYGNLIQTIVDFLLVALSIFFFVKIIAVARKKMEEKKKAEEAAAPAAPAGPTQEELLTEIRDLLKKN